MGLDVSSGLYYGILVRRDEILVPGPEVKRCPRGSHDFDPSVNFRFCPHCGGVAGLTMVRTEVVRPQFLAIWPDLTADLEEWKGERDTTWSKPGAVSFYDASQTRDVDGQRARPVLVLGVGLQSSASHRSGDRAGVCSVNEFVLDEWRPRIRAVANKAQWGGRPLELVVSTYLSY